MTAGTDSPASHALSVLPRVRAVLLALTVLCVAACATTQGTHRSFGASYPPKPAAFTPEVFASSVPSRAFQRIARLDAHFEKTGLVHTPIESALQELQKQARAAGADAIIEVREQRSRVGETRILHVTATGIRYTD